MSHENTAPTSNPDPVDQLLFTTFEQALTELDEADLVEVTMKRIAIAQRRRGIVFALIGILAAAICVLASLPLVALLQSAFSELTGAAALTVAAGELVGWQDNLPVLALSSAVAAGGVWLLLEEAF